MSSSSSQPQPPITQTASASSSNVMNDLATKVGLQSKEENEVKKWNRTFDVWAKKEVEGVGRVLDEEAFINAIAPATDFSRIPRSQYSILFRVAAKLSSSPSFPSSPTSTSSTFSSELSSPPPSSSSSSSTPSSSPPNYITLQNFLSFQSLLKKPDAEFQVAFKFFDLDNDGKISFDEFKRVLIESRKRRLDSSKEETPIPFDFESPWVKLYLGRRSGSGEHVLGYNEFTQLMKGLQGERLRQSFHHFDKDQDGYIDSKNFQKIILDLVGHKLSEEVVGRLEGLCGGVGEGIGSSFGGGRKDGRSEGMITYSEVVAFHNVIREMDLIESLIRQGCSHSPDGKITQGDFLTSASQSTRYGVFTPLEVRIVWHFAAGMDNDNNDNGSDVGVGEKRLGLKEFARLIDPKWEKPVERLELEEKEEEKSVGSGFLTEVGRSAYNFGLGGIAGGLGATFVYPIDLVKTRMQNQRSKVVGELLYKNSMDCAKKVYKNEGFLGFYRGLPPQLVGVAPEKAIKLTVNDLVRGKSKNKETGKVPLPLELFAGGAAGGCQVVFTNPLEIVKIRLQMQGEMSPDRPTKGVSPRGAGHIIRQLGLVGLYKGAGACLCRDIPFSAIYFPGYSHLKSDIFNEGKNGKQLNFGETLAAAGIAGMPAAYLTTPADVIKTRLQTEAKKGETNYKGILDAFQKISREEGPRALFKGGLARVLRSSPQFGVTLVAYEYLHTFIPFPGDAHKTPKPVATALAPPQVEEISKIRARNALKILLDVSGGIGLAGNKGSPSA